MNMIKIMLAALDIVVRVAHLVVEIQRRREGGAL